MSYNVLIVDDQTLPRQYFEKIVNDADDYNLTASISSAAVADAYCISNRIDLIIMDIVMSDGSNGLDAAARIKKSYPSIKILAVTSMPDSTFLTMAREANVDSFWYKEVQDVPMIDVMNRTMAIAGLLNRKDLQKSGNIMLDDVDLLNSSRATLRSIQGKEIGIVFQDPLNSMNPVLRVGYQVEETMRI